MIRRTLFVVFLIAALSLVALPMSAQYLVTVQTYHSVSGVDYAEVAPSMRVKLHNINTGYDYYGTSDPYGIARISADAGTYQAYIWDEYYYQWGSTDTPDPNPYTVYATFNDQVIRLSAFPRPFAPGLFSPCDGCYVGAGYFDLVWTSGIDAARTASNWPVSYELWDSTTLPGYPQQAEWEAISDMPCNPDSAGRCVYHVGYLDTCHGCMYTWRIVVKIDFGGGIVYKTSGPSWKLYQY